MIHAFLYGVILAFGLIIPLGVQNVFVFNQGATQPHYVYALPCVLTAFICDTILILCAVLGVSVIVLNIPWLKTLFFLIGFFFLLYMGFNTWKSKAKLQEGSHPLSSRQQIAFATSVSLLNPHALLDTVGVIGTNALHFEGSDKILYTLACILVSFFWFLGLSIAGHFVHRADKTGWVILVVNKISALIIWSVAFFIAWQLIKIFLH